MATLRCRRQNSVGSTGLPTPRQSMSRRGPQFRGGVLMLPHKTGQRKPADAVENGYTRLQKQATSMVGYEGTQVETVAEVVPTDFKLDLDPNGSWRDAETAIPVLQNSPRTQTSQCSRPPFRKAMLKATNRFAKPSAVRSPCISGRHPITTCVCEDVCTGFVIGGGKSQVMREGQLSAAADMPFWLQIVGNGLTTTWAGHLGSVLTHANMAPQLPVSISIASIYSLQPVQVADGSHRCRCPRVRR